MKPFQRHAALTITLALLSAATAHGQWEPRQSAAVPLTEEGAPDLDAPAPRTADGKPDFTGVWQGGSGGRAPALEFSSGPPVAGFLNVAQNIEGGLPLKP